MKSFIKNYIKNSIVAKEQILNDFCIISKIEESAQIIVNAYRNNGKILIAGNGGSAADAQHIATELVSKFYLERSALNAIALTTNTSAITAISNDYGYKTVFSRQIQAYANKKDVFIAISTSGNSENIIEAIKEARKLGLKVIGFSGQKACLMDGMCDVLIKVPSSETPIIQEAHIMLGHLISAIVERELFS